MRDKKPIPKNESSNSIVLSEFNGPTYSGNKYLLNIDQSNQALTTVSQIDATKNNTYFSIQNLFKVLESTKSFNFSNKIYLFKSKIILIELYFEMLYIKKNRSRYFCPKVIRPLSVRTTCPIKYGTLFKFVDVFKFSFLIFLFWNYF